IPYCFDKSPSRYSKVCVTIGSGSKKNRRSEQRRVIMVMAPGSTQRGLVVMLGLVGPGSERLQDFLAPLHFLVGGPPPHQYHRSSSPSRPLPTPNRLARGPIPGTDHLLAPHGLEQNPIPADIGLDEQIDLLADRLGVANGRHEQ